MLIYKNGTITAASLGGRMTTYKISAESSTGYAIVENKKEQKKIVNSTDENIVIYNKSNDKIYSYQNGKKQDQVSNKTGEPLTEANFGKKMKPLIVENILSDTTQATGKTPTKLLNNLLTQKINGVDFDSLVKRVESLESIVSSLAGSGGSGKDTNEDTDAITGLKTRVSSLEDAVKLEPVLPASNPDAGINYYLNRNYSDIKSNYDQLDDNYKLILQLQSNITSDYTTDLKGLDLLGMINSLAERVEALEA